MSPKLIIRGAGIAIALICLLGMSTGKGEPDLSNYGVRDRSLAGTALSQLVSRVEPIKANSYKNIEDWSYYINQCAAIYKIPPVTLAAILYEEGVHRKPVDLKTFGPAQLGLDELETQGFPRDPSILEDPELAIVVLSRKLYRLRKEFGSLDKAITLHNGYTDYLDQIKSREKDPQIRMILTVRHIRPLTSL